MQLEAGQRRSLESFAREGTRKITRFRTHELAELGLIDLGPNGYELTTAGSEELQNR